MLLTRKAGMPANKVVLLYALLTQMDVALWTATLPCISLHTQEYVSCHKGNCGGKLRPSKTVTGGTVRVATSCLVVHW
jgi:hypothetical protein